MLRRVHRVTASSRVIVDVQVVRALVAKVIDAQEFDGKEELLAQVPGLLVVAGPVTFLDVSVTGEAEPSPFRGRKVPGRAWVFDGDQPSGGLEVWLDDGYMTALEYWWITNDPPVGPLTPRPPTGPVRSRGAVS